MIKVCIDAGHAGKYNRSPADQRYYESEFTWKISDLQEKWLNEYGIKVVSTRTRQDVDLQLYARGTASRGCNLFISNHTNAIGGVTNDDVDYPLSITTLNGKADDIGLRLAKVCENILQTKQLGRINHRESEVVKGQEYFGVLRGAAAVGVPGLILEHSFHTNSRMVALFLDDNVCDLLAKEQAKAIARYFGISVNDGAKAENKWIKENGIYSMIKEDGKPAKNEWVLQNHHWYYFDKDGHMMTGWQKINGQWFFLDNTKDGPLEGACWHGNPNGSLEIWNVG